MKIYGRTIAARPAQADPGDIFVNLADDKRYVFGADGQWSAQLPVTPIDMGDYVKKTDYATTEKVGVMKVGTGLTADTTGTVSVAEG